MSDVHLPPAEQLRLPDSTFSKLRMAAVGAVLVGAVLFGVGYATNKESFAEQASFSYLFGFFFWLTLALGGLFFVLLHHLTRAGWSVPMRRTAEAMASTLPAFLVLFIPIIFAMHQLYPWMRPEVLKAEPSVAVKTGYLNETFFLIRAAIYLLIWTILARRMVKPSINQDYSGDSHVTAKLQSFSAGGMLLFAMSLTFAAFDWIMSLEPTWYSTIFGVYIFAGSALAMYALMALMGTALRRLPHMQNVITIEHMHAIGKFIFGFTVFWAYIGFSQYFLIWYANIPEETMFYKLRFVPGWVNASWALLLGQFALQFFIMLPREAKRVPAWLVIGASWVLTFHMLDIYWLVMPNRDPEGMHVTATDVGALLLVGGVFFSLVLRQLRGEALVPLRDPRLEEALLMEN